MELYVEKSPTTSRFFYCACDSVYFNTYTKGLIGSACLYENPLHVHVINPLNEDVALMKDLKHNPLLSFSYEYTVKASRADYASNRFHSLPMLIDKLTLNKDTNAFDVSNMEVMILDADGFFIKNSMRDPWFPGYKADVGLYFRDPLPGTSGMEYEATHVAAGAVYVSRGGMAFLREVSSRMLEVNSNQWFIDQLILWETYKAFKTDYTFVNVPFEFIDWEFSMNSFIWTGKGPRKDNNSGYLAKFETFSDYFTNEVCK